MRDLKPHLPRLLFFPAAIVWLELIFKWWTLGSPLGQGPLYTALFSIAIGFLLSFLSMLSHSRWVGVVLTAVVTLWFWINTVYHTIFKSFLALDSITMAGDAISNYWREALTGIWTTMPAILALAIPLALVCLFTLPAGGKRAVKTPRRQQEKLRLAALAAAVAAQVLALLLVNLSNSGVMSTRSVYRGEVIPELSVSNFGLLTTNRLDITHRLFGLSDGDEVIAPQEPVDPEQPEGPEGEDPETPVEPDVPLPVVYEDNVLNIDFAALAEQTDSKTIKALDQWVASRTPTKQNQYTGAFKGKNLIFITAEGFWKYAVDPELTPTLYKLANESFVFENFYNPLWWKSTIDGEYVACTGLIPSNQVFSFRTSGGNSMPFCMGNMLMDQGYPTMAYHNNTYTYYDRDQSHPNMGYDYKGLGNGLDVKKTWPQSDLEMMEKTIPQALAGELPFHNYYMTVSGHMNYNFMGNMMSSKHKDEVAHLDMSEEARAYLACNMEFDRAMEYVLDQLEQAGQLENTVICISADHYPYGMDPATWDELSGMDMDTDFEIFRSTLILWNGGMKEPVTITKPCCSMDILPTLLNLFGLEYDSRLLAGRDILSDSPGLVALSNRSFITEYGKYNSKTDQWTPNEGISVPEAYVSGVYKQVSDLFKHSGNIVTNDYYGTIEQRLNNTAPWQN